MFPVNLYMVASVRIRVALEGKCPSQASDKIRREEARDEVIRAINAWLYST